MPAGPFDNFCEPINGAFAIRATFTHTRHHRAAAMRLHDRWDHVHMAFVIDVFARCILGWRASSSMRKFATLRQAMDEAVDWLTVYNYQRLHSSLGYISPMQYEQRWHAAQHKNAA